MMIRRSTVFCSSRMLPFQRCLLQVLERRRREALRPRVVLAAEEIHEVPHEQRDVLAAARAAAARGSGSRSGGSRGPRGSVPFSISSSRFLFVAAMTRTSTLIVRAEPSRSTSPSCSTRSTLACVFGAHVADFVEEDRAAIGLLELADLLLGGAGERPLLVAEELRLDQLLGNRRAVDLDEPLAAAQAVAVDRARDELLADAALALDQHGRVGRRRAADRPPSPASARRSRRPSGGGLRPPA